MREKIDQYQYCEEFNSKPCPVEAHGDICTCILANSEDIHDSLNNSSVKEIEELRQLIETKTKYYEDKLQASQRIINEYYDQIQTLQYQLAHPKHIA